jgi:predicted CXXCH cytochrome family protein
MKKWIGRLCIGLMFALPMILVSAALTRASGLPRVLTADETQCKVCHEASFKAWETSVHGKAYTDLAFKDVWTQSGQPKECLTCHTTGYDATAGNSHAESISCIACHSQGIEDHPMNPLKVDRSAALCGECHTDTYFQLTTSKHGESGITCVTCHDPHTNALKYENAPDLCASCHGNRVSRFAHSQHASSGLSCESCHLEADIKLTADGHPKRNHTFNVHLATCTACHSYQIHGPADMAALSPTEEQTPAADAMSAVESAVVSTNPQPTNAIGFTVVSGLVGMAAGMILSPWLERWYRSFNNGNKEK